MTRAGVIINPKAGRGNGKGLALADALDRRAARVILLEHFDALEPALHEMAADGVEFIFISSGDGTIQAIQTFIAERRIFPKQPQLCLLPHGTTNMTAADIGFKRKSIAGQAAFIADPQPKSIRERPTLRVINPRDGKPRHGMFLGTGAVTEATRFTQRTFNDRGVKGSVATFATLAQALGKSLFSAPNPHDPSRFDRPFPITIRARDQLICEGVQLLALATTLEKLILGTKPFWGGKSGPIRLTVFPFPVPNLYRWFLPAIIGGENRAPPPGSKSLAANAFSIESKVDYVIDGEFFSGPSGEPLNVEAGPTLAYIVA